MMNKTWKKALAVILTFAMTASSFTGFASEVQAASTGEVTVTVDGDKVEIGNGYISREFSIANSKLSTVNITNKRTDGGNTVFTPAEGSEEFIIRLTKDEDAEAVSLAAIDRTGWTATADSYANASGSDGPAQNLLEDNTYNWHTNYESKGVGDEAFPYNVIFKLGGESVTFRSFSFTPRSAGSGINGNTKGYELYASNSSTDLEIESEEWTLISKGEFEYQGTNPCYVNLDEECTATQLKLVSLSSTNGNSFAGGEQFNLHTELAPVVGREFAASELELDGDPVIEATSATINEVAKTGQKITFKFAPYTYKDVTYTISEVVVMYDGDHFMRKYMEISVPEDQWSLVEIDYIDLESMIVNESDAQWTIPTDAGGVVSMDMFKANLGQPIYIQGMFFGCEFPETDTQIVDGTGYMRYYSGKDFTRLKTDNQLTTDGKYVTWQTVAGAARSTDNQVIQADFFEYIYSIATPSDFRIQYNSWFDNMMLISDENILETFIEFDRELNKVETRPLDSYVMDDGWINYNDTYVVDADRAGTTLNETGFWEFNSKFPDDLTPSSELANKFGSNFGLWVGPRGGYNFYGSLADIITKSGKGSKAGGSIDVADRIYIKNFTEMACEWQEKYDINYWKWDGFVDSSQYNEFAAADGVASYSETNHHMTGGYSHMYHVTDLWEGWIDLMEAVRANAATNEDIENLWISLTCYTNPSPWFLQWANSVWMQCVYDQKDASFGLTKLNKQMTYRDAMYYDFLKNHEFQFPLANVYNHDPIYGKEGTGMNIDTATDDDFQNYLYMQSTRGTTFWELYFSDSLMTDGKYEVTSEFLEWAEENSHMLRNAKYIGDAPDNTLLSNGNSDESAANAYGFSCFDGKDGIISIRNSSASENKTITFTFDRTIGVAEDAGTLKYHLEHSYLLSDGVASTGTFEYGKEYSFELEPNEVRIFRISENGDTTAPKMVRAYTDGDNVVTVKFDEKVTGSTFTVEGAAVASVEASADDITFRITLEDALEDGASAVITAADVKDKAGNACTETISLVHHTDNLVADSAVQTEDSLYTNNGFSVVARVSTTEEGTVVAQGEQYALTVNESGYATFTLNGTTAVSDVKVNDGEEHRVAGVKENNGILKIYVDGSLAGAAYNEDNRYYQVEKAAITVGEMATMAEVHDVAYGYDEIAVYNADFYTVTVSADENKGTAEVVDASDEYLDSSKVTVTAEAEAGYEFIGWTYKDSAEVISTDAEYTFVIKKDVELVANFKRSEEETEAQESTNLALNKEVSGYWTADDSEVTGNSQRPLSYITNGDTGLNNYGEFGADSSTDSAYIQVDLEASATITSMIMHRYWNDSRVYNGTVIAVSDTEDFEDMTIVYNSDQENFHGLGAGSDDTYAESSDGKTIEFEDTVTGRYVRVYMHGSSSGNTNHVVELQVMGYTQASTNLALGVTPTSAWTADDTDCSNSSGRITNTTNGAKTDTNDYWDFNNTNVSDTSAYAQYDLGSKNVITDINMWRYWGDSRTYRGTVIAVSNTKDFTDATVVYNSDADDVHGFGAGEDSTYQETSSGLQIELTEENVQGRYVRVYMHGSSSGESNHIVELEVIGYAAPVELEDPVYCQVTANVNDDAMGSVSISEPSEEGYEVGSMVTVTAVAADNYKFVNWTNEGTEVSKNAEYKFIMPNEDVTLVANFECKHANTEELAAVDATCTTSGLTAGQKCSDCGKTLAEQTVIPATGHTEVAIGEAKEPTCAEDGITAGVKCSECGEILTAQEIIPATGTTHNFGELISGTAASCTTEGTKEHKQCTLCGAYFDAEGNVLDTIVIPATGHTEVAIGEAKNATCTEDGTTAGVKCYECGDILTAQETIPATGHDIVTDVAVAPSCTTTGLTEGSHCSRCNDATVAQEEVAALGHSYGEYTEDAENDCHNRTCSVCKDVVSEAHFWVDGTCEKCGAEAPTADHLVEVYIDGTLNNAQSQTGVKEGMILTVTAPAVDGKVFSHWSYDMPGTERISSNKTYTFYVTRDMYLYANYADAPVEAVPNIVVSNTYNLHTTKYYVVIEVTRDIPSDYKVVEQGILYGTNEALEADTENDLTFADAEGTTLNDNVKKYKGTSTSRKGALSLKINLGTTDANNDRNVYARGYVVVEKDGVRTVVYTAPETLTYNGLN